MEVSALRQSGLPGLPGSVPLLRLQSDERLIALIRRGHHSAFEALVARYQARLLSFCRHMLGSKEDAEDVLQEVFAAAFNAILADERSINVRPWLYRIARNRSLNHLRRTTPVGVDSMDVYYAENGQSTGEKILRRESFRQLISDVQQLPETQRTALLLREIDALSYEQISETMQTTVPSVKSLLVRARISLAEAAEARKLSCDEVRLELGEVAEGLMKISAPVRRHVRECERCRFFRKQLKENNHALAAVFPVGPLLLIKKLVLAKLGSTASAGHVAAGGGATAAAGAGASVAGAGSTMGGLAGLGAGALATKAVAGLAAAALVTAGAVEADHAASTHRHHHSAAAVASSSSSSRFHADAAPVVIRSQPQPVTAVSPRSARIASAGKPLRLKPRKKSKPVAKPPTPALASPTSTTTAVTEVKPVVPVKPAVTEVTTETTVLPSDSQPVPPPSPPTTATSESQPPTGAPEPTTVTTSEVPPPPTQAPVVTPEQDTATTPPPPPNPEQSGGTPAPQTSGG
ncbi:MAG TPA: sigma-70 family RNA polymerase sigma factor [Solirubrobacteraceae bacterium]|jgi:RNA polymerase sigma factor (sigma-70 family)